MSPDPAQVPSVVTSAEARAAGITRAQLRGRAWERVGHGVFRSADASDPLQAFRDVVPALFEGAALAHLSAAQVYGMWLPRLPGGLSVLASLPPGVDRPERSGLYVFRSRAGLPPPHHVKGLRVVAPEVCLGQLAEDLSELVVVALDGALQMRLCTLADVLSAIRRRQRGLPVLRRALELCDGRSESPWETLLRVLHVTAGVEVEPQAPIRDDGGSVVARADLLLATTMRISEYDGAYHRDRSQHEDDLARDKMLARLGFERYGYIAAELLRRPEQVIRDAEAALGWPHDPRRLYRWRHLVERSSFTPEGRRRLYHRLHRFD